MPYRRFSANSLLLAALLVAAANTTAGAQPADEADRQYREFKQLYAAARTPQDLREALALVKSAYRLEPTDFRYTFGIGATYERLAEFSDCRDWYEEAIELADPKERRELAQHHWEYCQNKLDKQAVLERSPTIRISFATKLAFARREFDAFGLPNALSNVTNSDAATLLAELRGRLPSDVSVVSDEHLVVAARGGTDDAAGEGERIAEYEAQIRR